jgi:hypothetical protein
MVTAVHGVQHRKRVYGRSQQTCRYEGQPGQTAQVRRCVCSRRSHESSAANG